MLEDRPPVILMYHDVRDPDQTAYPRRYEGTSFLTTLQFEQQLDYLESRYTIVSLSDLQLRRANGGVPPRTAVLTFDDGLADHFDRVRPVLLRRGLPASFFIPTAPVFRHVMIQSHKIQFLLAGEIDEPQLVQEIFRELDEVRPEFPSIPSNAELWGNYSVSLWPNNVWTPEQVFVTRLLRSGLQPSQARERILDRLFAKLVDEDETAFAKEFYISPGQVATLHSDGFEIGSHGHTSNPLTMLTREELRGDLAESASMLSEHVLGESGPAVSSISYPNGEVNEDVALAAETCGFTIGLTTEAIPVTASHSELRLPRLNAPAVLPPKAVP